MQQPSRVCSRTLKKCAQGMRILEIPGSNRAAPAPLPSGTFVSPTLIEIPGLTILTGEVFGPILHVLRWRHDELPALLDAISASGYGLTLGVQSRIDAHINFIISRSHVGNLYVNRSMIGAVVGTQPFGGEAQSGTGPKAGGPLYLQRLQQADPASAPVPEAWTSTAGSGVPQLPRSKAYAAWRHSAPVQENTAYMIIHAGAAKRMESFAAELTLPGPTGETNTLSLHPRGSVLCLPGSHGSLVQQLDAVFFTGNRALILEEHLSLLPQPLPWELQTLIQAASPLQLERTVFHAALVDQTMAAA